MTTKITTILVLVIAVSACSSSGKRNFERTAELSSGVRAILNAEPDVSLNDPRIRCKREAGRGSRLGRQTCRTVEEIEADRSF